MTPILEKKHNFFQLFQFSATKNKIKQIFYEELNQLGKYIIDIKDKYEPNYKEINKESWETDGCCRGQ